MTSVESKLSIQYKSNIAEMSSEEISQKADWLVQNTTCKNRIHALSLLLSVNINLRNNYGVTDWQLSDLANMILRESLKIKEIEA